LKEKNLERQLKEWTKANVIEPSVSSCKKKGTDKLIWAVHYHPELLKQHPRALNSITVYNLEKLFTLYTDLSGIASGGVLSQVQGEQSLWTQHNRNTLHLKEIY